MAQETEFTAYRNCIGSMAFLLGIASGCLEDIAAGKMTLTPEEVKYFQQAIEQVVDEADLVLALMERDADPPEPGEIN